MSQLPYSTAQNSRSSRTSSSACRASRSARQSLRCLTRSAEAQTYLDKLVPADATAQDTTLTGRRSGKLRHEWQQARQPRRLFAHVLEARPSVLSCSRSSPREGRLETLNEQRKHRVERERADEGGVRRVERV